MVKQILKTEGIQILSLRLARNRYYAVGKDPSYEPLLCFLY
jgi:hypothetical protein